MAVSICPLAIQGSDGDVGHQHLDNQVVRTIGALLVGTKLCAFILVILFTLTIHCVALLDVLHDGLTNTTHASLTSCRLCHCVMHEGGLTIGVVGIKEMYIVQMGA